MDTSQEYILMCEKAVNLQNSIFEQKVIPKEELFFIKAKGETVTFHDKDRVLYQNEAIEGIWFVEDTVVNTLPIPFTTFSDDDFFYSYLDKRSGLNFIWLPRQDQLQEMIWHNDWDYIAKQHILAQFCSFTQKQWDDTGIFTSMEQLWLAFVMYEKFGKVWKSTKKEWEKRVANDRNI